MKVNFPHKIVIIFLITLSIGVGRSDAQDSVESKTTLNISYFLSTNNVPYISINVKKKTGRKIETMKDIPVNVYFSDAKANNLLGKTITGISGEGRVGFPASFKSTWDSLNEFKFLATSDPIRGIEPLSADITIKKAILVIDTANADGVRTVTAQLKEKKGNDWVAVPAVEMKLAIDRSLGSLSVGDAETYTSDSTGKASAEFKKDSIPGDEKGNIILVARVEDNDSYGNLVVEKTVSWGKASIAQKGFWRRTLWSTGNRAPLWLLGLAFSIIAGVWGVIFYLVRQLFKLRKMGRAVLVTDT